MSQIYLFVAFPASLAPLAPEAPVFCDPHWNSQVLHPLQYTDQSLEHWRKQSQNQPLFWIEAGSKWQIHVQHDGQCQSLSFDPQKIDAQSEAELYTLFEAVALAEGVEKFCPLKFPTGVYQWPGGPLPALLEAMQIKAAFQGWQARFEKVDDGFVEASDAEEDWFSAVLAESQHCPLQQAPHPLELPTEALMDLYRLAWLADMRSDLVFELSSSLPELPAEAASEIQVRPLPQDSLPWAVKAPNGKQLALNPHGSAGQVGSLFQDLLFLLRDHWQADSVWQLHAAPTRDPECDTHSEVRLRFAGKIIKKNAQAYLSLSHWPEGLSKQALQAALALSQWVKEGGRFALNDAAEEKHTLNASLKAFELQSDEVQRGESNGQKWLEIKDSFKRALFASRVFLYRHAHDFKMESAVSYRKAMEEPWEELGDTLAQLLMRPSTGKILYAGESGEFIEAEASDRNAAQQQSFELLSQELSALGFQPLGSFIWKTGGDIRNTVFGHPDARAYAMIMESLTGKQYTEFFSAWENGRSRTSSNNPDAHDTPAKQIEQRPYAKYTLAEIWEIHSQHVDENPEGLEACPPDLDIFLKRLDRFLCHQLY